MTDKEKNKKQLMSELAQSRLRIAALEQAVSELQNRLRDVERSESKFRTVAEHTYDWEFWLSPGAEFLYCSPSTRRITGYEPDDFSSDPGLFYRIIHPDDLIAVAENLNRKRMEKGFCELEFRIIARNGETRRIALAFHGIYDENANYLGIRGSGREIIMTARRDGEETESKKTVNL